MSTEPDRIDALAFIEDHQVAGLALLPRQVRDKPLLRALVGAYLRQVQDLEGALWLLLVQGALDQAIGAHLDQIGGLLLVPRGALVDTAYRAVLFAAARAYRTRGRARDVIEALAAALGPNVSFTYDEGGASILLTPDAPIGFDAAPLLAVLKIAKAAGVQLELIDPPAPSSGLFTYASGLRAETDSARGYSDTSGTTGGVYTGVVG